MEIINGTKFVMDVQLGMDHHGKRFLVAEAKATFRIPEEGSRVPMLAEQQQPLLASDVFEAEPGLSNPFFEADGAYSKPRCDVVVKATAHAPGGKAVYAMDVAFRVGACSRSAHVVGNRRWKRGLLGLTPSGPEPFVQMPITYSRAFGGTLMHQGRAHAFMANPIGCGFGGVPSDTSLVDAPVPNIEFPGEPIEDPRGNYRPTSFGPVGRSWAGRIEYGGTYDQQWIDDVFPLPPADFDTRYFQCAPAEQQIDFPRGGEEVGFLNLHPKRQHVVFALPSLDLAMVVLDHERRPHRLRPVVDTLVFDLDAEIFTVVWRAQHPLRRSLDELDALAAGNLCKRWWKARVLGTADCGCGGFETNDEDIAPVSEVLE